MPEMAKRVLGDGPLYRDLCLGEEDQEAIVKYTFAALVALGLTGAAAEIAKVCGYFGVSAWQDDGLLTHSLHTAVIGRDGRLVQIKDIGRVALGAKNEDVRVRIDGQDIAKISQTSLRRSIGVVFQEPLRQPPQEQVLVD